MLSAAAAFTFDTEEQIQMLQAKADPKLAVRPLVRECPVCHHPQTRIQRRIGVEKLGAVNYVCARAADCCLGINLTNVDTWVVV